MVQSAEPEKKICVVDIDEIESKEDVEFLVGVGVASIQPAGPSNIGYEQICATNLFIDLLHENGKYDSEQVLKHTAVRALKSSPNVPVFKYLHELGINSQEKYEASGYFLDKAIKRDLKKLGVASYKKSFFRFYRHLSLQEIIDKCTVENASAYIPYLSVDKIDLSILHNFLLENEDKLDYKVSSYASNFKKLVCLYDRLKWGWR